jgi:hypothetical protein
VGPALGLTAIILAVAAVIVTLLADFVFINQAGHEFRIFQQNHWEANETTGEGTALLGPIASAGIVLIFMQILASILGIVGFILGIVAVVRRSLRPVAVAAIVVAGAAPIVSIVVFSLTLEAQ